MNIMKMKAVLRKKTTPKPDKIGKRNTMVNPKLWRQRKLVIGKSFTNKEKEMVRKSTINA